MEPYYDHDLAEKIEDAVRDAKDEAEQKIKELLDESDIDDALSEVKDALEKYTTSLRMTLTRSRTTWTS